MANANRHLARGPEVRSARATMKRAMREDFNLALTIVAGDSPQWEETAAAMSIEALLLVVPGVGLQLVTQLLDSRRIPPAVQGFGLTSERRAELAQVLREELGA